MYVDGIDSILLSEVNSIEHETDVLNKCEME